MISKRTEDSKNRRLLAISFAIVALAACSGAPDVGSSAEDGIAAARADLEQGRYESVFEWTERLAGTEQESQAWYIAGKAHRKLGSLDAAVDAFERSAVIEQNEGDFKTAAILHRHIVMIYRERTQYRPAIEHASRAAELAARADAPGERAHALSLLVGFFLDIGDLRAARWALSELKQVRDPQNADLSARISEHEGALRSEEGRFALARAAHEQTLALAEHLDDGFLRGVNLNLVEANLSLGEIERAREHLQRAESHIEPEIGETTGLRYHRAKVLEAEEKLKQALEAYRHAAQDEQMMDDWLWQCEVNSGMIHLALGDREKAMQAFERSIEVVERMRAEMQLDGFKASFLEKKRRPYEQLFRVQASGPRPADALATLERSKARALVDAMIDSSTGEAPSPSAQSAEQAAHARLDALNILLPAIHESPVTQPRSIEELLRESRQRVVLSYYEADGSFWLARIASGRVKLFELEPGSDEIQMLVRRWLAAPSAVAPAELLGAALLPDGLELPEGAHIYVSPDGILRRIPFAALRREGRFLVESFSISYVPSLTALLAIEARGSRASGAPVVAANPDGDLPHAEDEARGVARQLQVEPLLGDALDLSAVMAARRAPLLHIATHGGIDTAGSWLQLHDGRLYADQVVARGIAPRIVVAAGCSTAVGHDSGVWGTIGTAFLAAGSQSVVASLWSIEDSTTRDFVLELYDRGGSTRPAAALADVQRAWIKQGVPVRKWAPYVSLGAR